MKRKHPSAPLSPTFVRTVKPGDKPKRYGDGRGGHGLSLLVKPGKYGRVSKSWSQRVKINGRETNIGLGAYPLVTLAEAREMALANRRAILQGRDPRSARASSDGGIPTFREALERVIEIRRTTWKPGGRSEQQWRSEFGNYILPRIGDKRISAVTAGDVMGAMTAGDVWNRRRAVARRLLQWTSVVMRWAVAEGLRADDPVPAIKQALPSRGVKTTHQRALPHGGVADALAKVSLTASTDATKGCFRFMVLTATRNAEVRGARWAEIDMGAAVWTLPAGRMKAGRAHRIPLSDAALAVLADARRPSTGGDIIFAGRSGRELDSKTLSHVCRLAGIEAVPHGFRSSFRMWCADTAVPREVAEACLAHAVKNQAEAAYARSDMLDRRRAIMQKWGEYCDAS